MQHSTRGTTVAIDMKFEVAILPVSDVDRAKHFYESLRLETRRRLSEKSMALAPSSLRLRARLALSSLPPVLRHASISSSVTSKPRTRNSPLAAST